MYNIDNLSSALMHKPTEAASKSERGFGGESEAFRKSLEEKDAELQRLVRHVTAQEAKLQQISTTSHELQLRQQIDILSGLAESRRQLVEAEDE